MPIEVRMSSDFGIQLVKFSGAVTNEQAQQLGRLHESRPDLLAADSVQIIDEDADLRQLRGAPLQVLRSHYNRLHRRADFLVLRRSGWICRSASAWRLVEIWLEGRHAHDGQGADVSLVGALADLAPMFTAEELEAISLERGFDEIARFAPLGGD